MKQHAPLIIGAALQLNAKVRLVNFEKEPVSRDACVYFEEVATSSRPLYV